MNALGCLPNFPLRPWQLIRTAILLVGGSSQAAKLFRQMQLFLEVLNDVLEFRQIFRRRLDQGLVSFQHRLRPSGAVFFQRYWKSLPVLFYGAHVYVEKLVRSTAA